MSQHYDLVVRHFDRITFNKGAIMRRAYEAGRFAFAACRNLTERRRQLSVWLRKAWTEAKGEAYRLRHRAEIDAVTKARVALLERNAAALAASFRNDGAAIRFEIEREHYRQHFQPTRIDALRGALASIGA